jgi:hypothetical protein
MKRLDYTALYNGLTATLKRKPTSNEVIDAVVKAGFVGSGFRRVQEGKRVFLEQEDDLTTEDTKGTKEKAGGLPAASSVPVTGIIPAPVCPACSGRRVESTGTPYDSATTCQVCLGSGS